MKFAFDDDGKTSEMPINPEKVNPFEEVVCNHEYLADGGPCTKCHKTVTDSLRDSKKDIDIQAMKASIEMALSKVGVNEVHIPIKYRTKGGAPIKLETVVSMYVNLTPEIRGINMSRLIRTLYKHVEADRDISTDLMEDLLKDFQKNLGSTDVYLKFKFNYPIKKKSLISDNYGWSYYPVEFEAKLVDEQITYTMMVSVYYMSVCPCSSSLVEQMKQGYVTRNGEVIKIDDLKADDRRHYEDKQNNVIQQVGAAHAQRSRADVKIKFTKDNSVWIEDVVQTIEEALKTAVQVVVRREDEQFFGKLCGENLMFVEDATRRMSKAIDELKGVNDYCIVANHYEGLHASNAIAVNWKGIKDGLR